MASGRLRLHHDGAQESEHWSTDAVGVAMGVLSQLGVAGPVPLVFNALALPHESQQDFLNSAHAGEEQVSPDIAPSLASQRVGDHLHDPGATRPVGLDVLRCFSGP